MSVWKRPSDVLIGRAVTGVGLSDDDGGLLIELDGGWTLHVVNQFSVSEGGSVRELVGKTLIAFVSESTFERLTFSNGAALIVDLGNDKWSGPEAMTLSGPYLFVVWKRKAPAETEALLRTAAAARSPCSS